MYTRVKIKSELLEEISLRQSRVTLSNSSAQNISLQDILGSGDRNTLQVIRIEPREFREPRDPLYMTKKGIMRSTSPQKTQRILIESERKSSYSDEEEMRERRSTTRRDRSDPVRSHSFDQVTDHDQDGKDSRQARQKPKNSLLDERIRDLKPKTNGDKMLPPPPQTRNARQDSGPAGTCAELKPAYPEQPHNGYQDGPDKKRPGHQPVTQPPQNVVEDRSSGHSRLPEDRGSVYGGKPQTRDSIGHPPASTTRNQTPNVTRFEPKRNLGGSSVGLPETATMGLPPNFGTNAVGIRPIGVERSIDRNLPRHLQNVKRQEGHGRSDHLEESSNGNKSWTQNLNPFTWRSSQHPDCERELIHEGCRKQFGDLYSDSQAHLQLKDKKITDLEEKLRISQASNLRLEDKQEELESTLRKAQCQLFKSGAPSQRISDQDSTILADFKRLQDRIKAFAKSYAVDTNGFLDDLHSLDNLGENERNALEQYLSSVIRTYPNQPFPWKEVSDIGKRAPALCVAATMAHEISKHLLDNPFFFIPEHNTLGKLYEDMQSINQSEAHTWRSQLLQMLNSSRKQISDNPAAEAIVAGALQTRRNTHELFSSGFLEGPAVIFFKPLSEEDIKKRTVESLRIFDTAGDLSYRLWSEKTLLKTHGLQEMAQARDVFSFQGELMEGHALHKLRSGEDEDEEDGAHRFDGQPPRIVVFPAILRYGTRDADDYETRRIWSPAIVLMDD